MIPCRIFLAVPFFSPPLRTLWGDNLRGTPCTLEIFTHQKMIDFMKVHATEPQLRAFNTLVPWAYKVDLWRAVALYEKGGIFIDADTRLLKSPAVIVDLTMDVVQIPEDRGKGCLWNGFIASPRHNVHLKMVINRIVQNVRNRVRGHADGNNEPSLGITGPCTYGRALRNNYRSLGRMAPDGSHVGHFATVESSVKATFSTHYAVYGGNTRFIQTFRRLFVYGLSNYKKRFSKR